MKRKIKFKKIISFLSIICITSSLIIGVSAYDATSNDIIGEWEFNQHIQPPSTSSEETTQVLNGININYTFNNVQKSGSSFIFIRTDHADATYVYRMGIVNNSGVDYVYTALHNQGGWQTGQFDSNFDKNFTVISVGGGQSNLNNIYNWLSTNATKTQSTTDTTYITYNNISTLITFNNNSTWREWINSNYNTINAYTDTEYIYIDRQRMYDNSGNWVKIDDTINDYSSPGIAYFFRSFDLTFTINDEKTSKTFTYISSIVTWADYVPTNTDFYIDENKVYYLNEHLYQNGEEVRAEDIINDRTYNITFSFDWYQGYEQGYQNGLAMGGGQLDIGSIIDATITGAKSIFVNSFGFELFGINIASTLISILVIAIVLYFIKKLR